jgi:class 3 adenylate cyclase
MTERMGKSLTTAPIRIDLFDRKAWHYFLKNRRKAAGLVSQVRGCFPAVGSEVEPIAVWGFDVDRQLLKYFCGEWLFEDGLEDPYEDRRQRMGGLIDIGIRAFPLLEHEIDIKSFMFLIEKSENCATKEIYMELKRNAEHYVFRHIQINKLTYLGLFWIRTDKRGKGIDPLSAERKIIRSINRLGDYFEMHGKIWDNCPFRIFSISSNSSEAITNVFSDPLSFSPADSGRDGVFFWPWQRCLIMRMRDNTSFVDYAPVVTTSVVVDLRGSTTAMSSTSDAGKFADFIDKVVAKIREIILDNGGFFDKDTGDGAIGHFCGRRDAHSVVGNGDSEVGDSIVCAINAGKKIIADVSLICEDYQKFLSHGLDGLGPSVGIHTGKAVWLVNEGQVKAIGDSVVWASRLCSIASSKELLISNGSYNLGGALESSHLSVFSRRKVSIKEYADSLSPFAYSYNV